ncbi:MAG: DMT family transporter [Segniliparus sp.]|uniref:DMT family transporter n=1 Tax=Segniliparus sp. TaxID=2804064 RepID=UPI003F389828
MTECATRGPDCESPEAVAEPAGRTDLRVVSAVAVSVVFWASAFVAIRGGAKWFDPGALAFGRLATGALVLVAIWLLRREGLPPRAAWPGIVGSGLLWFALYMVVLNWGERLVDAGTAAMLVNVGPVLTVLLGGWLLREGFPPRLLAGLAVAFLGAVVVGLASRGSSPGSTSWLGVGLCLVAALCYALGIVLQKPALRHASSLQTMTFSCLIGALACAPFAGRLWSQAAAAPPAASGYFVYLGVFPTALGYLTWGYALARMPAGRLGITTYAVPAIVVLMSWAILGEVPGIVAILGGALCLAGVAVARSKPKAGPA